MTELVVGILGLGGLIAAAWLALRAAGLVGRGG